MAAAEVLAVGVDAAGGVHRIRVALDDCGAAEGAGEPVGEA